MRAERSSKTPAIDAMRKLITALTACALLAFSCTKGDGDADYGNTYIYIPQAMFDGGLTSEYPVPSGDGNTTYNFLSDGDGIHILMGVIRSGKEAGQAFTVRITATSSDFPTYTLPEKVSVEAGSNRASFSLDLPLSVLDEFKDRKPAITVAITEPTAYQLAAQATSVRVVVDINALAAIIR